MKAPRDPLAEVLQSWRVTPPADPDFRSAVWRRISRRVSETWPAYLRAHAAPWAVAAVVLVGAAGYTGHAAARARGQTAREAIVATYLTGLDPWVQAGLQP